MEMCYRVGSRLIIFRINVWFAEELIDGDILIELFVLGTDKSAYVNEIEFTSKSFRRFIRCLIRTPDDLKKRSNSYKT